MRETITWVQSLKFQRWQFESKKNMNKIAFTSTFLSCLWVLVGTIFNVNCKDGLFETGLGCGLMVKLRRMITQEPKRKWHPLLTTSRLQAM
jgi:hypothetical protein